MRQIPATLAPLWGSFLNDTFPRACARGYDLTSLRGSIGMRLFAATFVPMRISNLSALNLGEFVIMPPWASEIIRDNVLSIDMTSTSRTH